MSPGRDRDVSSSIAPEDARVRDTSSQSPQQRAMAWLLCAYDACAVSTILKKYQVHRSLYKCGSNHIELRLLCSPH
jgi:hypothetical protein